MAGFSQKQLEQFEHLLKPIYSKLSDIGKQQGDLWETTVRQSVQSQYGQSFSMKYTVTSLQHLAKRVCCSTGWSAGSDAVDICRVAERFASKVLDDLAAIKLLTDIQRALVQSAGDQNSFARLGQQIQAIPWFKSSGSLDMAALGHSLPAFEAEEQGQIKSKLEELHRLLSDERSGQLKHLLTCRSPGVLLALYSADPSKYQLADVSSFRQLAQRLPDLQLQIDVRGEITMINKKVIVEVGGIERNLKKYGEGKQQLISRAKVLQWAVQAALDETLEFVLIGHLFVPCGKPDDDLPSSDITDSVTVFTHQLCL